MGLSTYEGLSTYNGSAERARARHKSVSNYAQSRPRDEKGRFINDKQARDMVSMDAYYQWNKTEWLLAKNADHVVLERHTFAFTNRQKFGFACVGIFILLAVIF